MSAFQQALAAASTQQQGESSSSSMSIKGTAGAAPSARGLASALRGIKKDGTPGMEVDGATNGRSVRGAGAARGRRGGVGGVSGGTGEQPNDRHRQTGRPYGARPGRNSRSAQDNNQPPPTGSAALAARMGRQKPINPKRMPAGTPPILKGDAAQRAKDKKASQTKLAEMLRSDEMKQWIRSRVIEDGVLNMSGLQHDPWLKQHGILHPGHRDAPDTSGAVFWKLIDNVLQGPGQTKIHTLSLADNDFHSLHQLSRLPSSLPYLRALDLSKNPIRHVQMLDELLSQGEKKGKANAGLGGLKILAELKLNECHFREETVQKPNGADLYQHDILKRFPGLLILDGVNLNRILFPISRGIKERWTDELRNELRQKPFTFPFDVKPGFMETDGVSQSIMQFCAKFFPLWDNDRDQCLAAYAPTATISACSNTLRSRSVHYDEVQRSNGTRPSAQGFDRWTNLPGRNLLRGTDKIDMRMRTLKSPSDPDELRRWWNESVPKTQHPLDDPSKWSIDGWVLDGTRTDTRLCAMIQGEFRELPSGTYRSFTRTLVLTDVGQNTVAQSAGWPAMILSDTLVVHPYFGTGAFTEPTRSLAIGPVTIQPPSSGSQDALVDQVRQRTGMNQQYAAMCLTQNGWDLETAVRNFEEIKGSIPPEAYQQ